MPGGNELADPAPGDFNAAPLSDRVGRWLGWGGGRAARSGDALRARAYPRSTTPLRSWTGEPALHRKPPASRERTSGATCFVVLLISAPPSQELEPATILGRFSRPFRPRSVDHRHVMLTRSSPCYVGLKTPIGDVSPPFLLGLEPTPLLPNQQPETRYQQCILAKRCLHGHCMQGFQSPIPLRDAIEIGETLKIAAGNSNTLAAGID